MRRLARYLVTATTLLSLLFCMASVVLWVRSAKHPAAIEAGYWHYQPHQNYPTYFDAWKLAAFNADGRWGIHLFLQECVVGPGRGEVVLDQKPKLLDRGADSLDDAEWAELDLAKSPLTHWAFGCRYLSTQLTSGLSIPHRTSTALFAILPLLAVIRRIVHRLRPPATGLCQVCGYDLRATPSRCPECGTVPKRQPL